jgi:hypothetical protein
MNAVLIAKLQKVRAWVCHFLDTSGSGQYPIGRLKGEIKIIYTTDVEHSSTALFMF